MNTIDLWIWACDLAFVGLTADSTKVNCKNHIDQCLDARLVCGKDRDCIRSLISNNNNQDDHIA